MSKIADALAGFFGSDLYTEDKEGNSSWRTEGGIVNKIKDYFSGGKNKQQDYINPTSTPAAQYGSGFEIPNVPKNLAQTIGEIFSSGKYGEAKHATDSASILKHDYGEQVKGYGHGENAQFKVSNIDVPNKIDENGNWDDNAPVKQFKSPFPSLGTLDSIDRGLWRINNATFLNYLADSRLRPIMYQYGIIDSPHTNWDGLNKDVINEYWNRMEDPVMNTKMAKIILDFQGPKAWYAAPVGLVNKNLSLGGK